MKVLVTGGAGYIGSHLIGALRQAGHVIRVLDLRPACGEHLTDPGCDFVQGSVANAILAAQAVQDVKALPHRLTKSNYQTPGRCLVRHQQLPESATHARVQCGGGFGLDNDTLCRNPSPSRARRTRPRRVAKVKGFKM